MTVQKDESVRDRVHLNMRRGNSKNTIKRNKSESFTPSQLPTSFRTQVHMTVSDNLYVYKQLPNTLTTKYDFFSDNKITKDGENKNVISTRRIIILHESKNN